MAEDNEGTLIQQQTQLAVLALANLFLYGMAMFTLPFVAYFGMRHILTEYYRVDKVTVTVWSVLAAVTVVIVIICIYAYKAYHEKEYDEDGNQIDQHSYTPAPPTENDKRSLNTKEE